MLIRAPRNIVPRWRLFAATATLGELAATKPGRPLQFDPDMLATLKAQWEIERTVWHATDLLSAAFVVGKPDEARDAAFFILSNDEGVALPATHLARRIIGHGDADLNEPTEHDWRATVRKARNQLSRHPRNAVRWMDLALAHTILGNRDQAIKCARVALRLAPDNRFVLRSATRCLLHWHDPEQAHNVIRASERTTGDPWLLAAEIAVATARGRKSRHVGLANGMLGNRNISQANLSELAAAVATHEALHGSLRKASKLFNQSLAAPTENAVAQARWAVGDKEGLRIVATYNEDVPRLFEARARDSFIAGDWQDTLDNALLWLGDQPFSSAPASLAAYNLHLLMRDKEAADLIRRAKHANPDEPAVLNGLMYYQLLSGEVDSARITFESLRTLSASYSSIERIIVTATTGLLEFRSGNPLIGRMLYVEAIANSEKNNRYDLKVSATANLAREEARSGNIALAAELLRDAGADLERLRHPEAPQREIALAERYLGRKRLSE